MFRFTIAVVGVAIANASRGLDDMCAPPSAEEGGCSIDGLDCDGTRVTLRSYPLNVSNWDKESATSSLVGTLTSYAILGAQDTWQMYLHGPHFRPSERDEPEGIPPVYVFGTFVNKVYRFDNFSPHAVGDSTVEASLKFVGHTMAPSTGFPINDATTGRIKGLLVAEGEPFFVSPGEIWSGGVQMMHRGHETNCTTLFPTGLAELTGRVVNTIDCHAPTGICFFSVWVFYDDSLPLVMDDCLYYCVMEDGFSTSDNPRCKTTGVLNYANGTGICHREGIGAVHGFTVGNTDPLDPTQFDLLLVFTGKATLNDGESSMQKVRVQVTRGGFFQQTSVNVLNNQPFAVDLFTKYGAHGLDVGGDHAWVDDTGLYVWISCFRIGGLGVHMVSYETGELLHSVTGLLQYAPDQYTYTAGVHGVGTIGKSGSFLTLATSSCKNLDTCIPTVPWTWPVPEQDWTTAPFILIDLSSMQTFNNTEMQEVSFV